MINTVLHVNTVVLIFITPSQNLLWKLICAYNNNNNYTACGKKSAHDQSAWRFRFLDLSWSHSQSVFRHYLHNDASQHLSLTTLYHPQAAINCTYPFLIGWLWHFPWSLVEIPGDNDQELRLILTAVRVLRTNVDKLWTENKTKSLLY